MKKRRILLALLGILVGWGTADMAQAKPSSPTPPTPVVSFLAGDEPGSWFTCTNTGTSTSGIGCVPASIVGPGQKSLAVIRPGESVAFPSLGGRTRTVHTAASLLYPTEAAHMPFKVDVNLHLPQPIAAQTVTLKDPGLYVFFCDIHVYMFAAVIVDDPNTEGLDLGDSITTVNGITVPTSSDLATRLLRTFFIATDPGNWQNYASSAPWHVTYPDVPVKVDIGVVPLRGVLNARYGNDITLEPLSTPGTPGVGEVWVNTQFEETSGKNKPGTSTAISATTWQPTRKVALPQINMNNPHNMWTDKNQEVIYQTQWFDETVTVFNRTTGAFVRNLDAGPAPSHVMTRANNDQVHVAQNGGNNVREFNALAGGNGYPPNGFIRDIPMGNKQPAKKKGPVPPDTHPHGHWMSADGNKMVTPNENVASSTVYNFPSNVIEATIPVGHAPIATGMMPDASKYYVANFLDSTISVIDMNTHAVLTTINLIANYDPVGGGITGPVGALPVQTPVSPDGKHMVTANTLTGTITVVDTRPGLPTTDTVVAMLGCDPGCHGVQYGAKDGGGYYAYVASKFSNTMLVVDPDPDGDGNPADAVVVGRILLTANGGTAKDATITGNPGMGGQGVLPIPLVYHGWVQQWVNNCTTNDCNTWKGQLTSEQKAPLP